MNESGSTQLAGYLAALGTVLIWTGFILVSRLGGRADLTGFDVLALRLGVASLLLLPFAFSLPADAWRDGRLWLLSVLGGAIFGMLCYSGFMLVPAAHGAVLLPGIQPFMVALMLWLGFGQRPSRASRNGLAFIALGIGLMAEPYLTGANWSASSLRGDLLVLAASAAWALYSVLAKRWAYDPWTLTRFVALSSALLYLPMYVLFLPKHIASVPLSALVVQGVYQGIGPAILAMLFFLKAVSVLGAERLSSMIAMIPVLAGLAAVPLLHEPLTGWLMAGLLAVSVGAYLAARPTQAKPAAAAVPCEA